MAPPFAKAPRHCARSHPASLGPIVDKHGDASLCFPIHDYELKTAIGGEPLFRDRLLPSPCRVIEDDDCARREKLVGVVER